MTNSRLPQKISFQNRTDCILCGRCLSVCPVFSATNKEELSPRSKGFLVRNIQEMGTLSLQAVRDLAGLCAGCERCSGVCPQGIDISALVSEIKHASPGWREWVMKMGFRHQSILRILLSGWKGGPQKEIFQQGRQVNPWLLLDFQETDPPMEQAVLFPGCAVDAFFPNIKGQALKLAGAVGTDCLPCEWSCCGFPLGRAGLFAERDRYAEENLVLWRELGRIPIITLCATCNKGLSEYARYDIGWEKGERDLWLRSLFPLHGLLSGARVITADVAPDGGVLYHQPCHGKQMPSFFERLFGSMTRFLKKDSCCGFGGELQITNPSVSRAVADGYWKTVPDNPFPQVLTDCSGCLLQLRKTGPQGVQIGHWVESLAV